MKRAEDASAQTGGEKQSHVWQIYQEAQDPRKAYICSRIEDQIDYYEKKSSWNKRLYYGLSVAAITANALVPVLSLFIVTETHGSTVIKVLVTALSSLAVVISTLLTLFSAKELWAKYRSSASSLTSLLHQYYTRTGAFEGLEDEQAFLMLAKLSETHFNEESKAWGELSRRDIKLKGGA